MLKQCKVVMLPTNEKAVYNSVNEFLTRLSLFESKGGYRHKVLSLERYMNGQDFDNPQHLYIISDDETKEDDWVILKVSDRRPLYCVKIKTINNLDKTCTVEFPYDNSTIEVFISECKKIIATTDSSLWEHDDTVPYPKTRPALPRPSDSFIQKYVEEYNKGNQIVDVLVEYEEIFNYKISYEVPFDIKLKVNPKDNTMFIMKTIIQI